MACRHLIIARLGEHSFARLSSSLHMAAKLVNYSSTFYHSFVCATWALSSEQYMSDLISDAPNGGSAADVPDDEQNEDHSCTIKIHNLQGHKKDHPVAGAKHKRPRT